MTAVLGGEGGRAVLAARHIPLLIDGAASDSRHREERND